jgi:type I restriction enzyme S subunit
MQPDSVPLRDICSLIVDCPHSTPEWTDGGFVVIRNQNIKNGRLDLTSPSFTNAEHFAHRIRRAKPTEGDIVITREAPMGEVCMVPSGLECCVGQRQVLLRPDRQKVDGRFLLYALQSPQVQRQIDWNSGTGSTVSNLRIPILEALNIPMPDMESQSLISSLLGALDDQIDLIGKTNTTLEAIAQAIFKSWFIEFDPVKANMQRRIPDGIDEATAALFPDAFEESTIGPVPLGWRVDVMGALVHLTKGCSYKGGGLSEDSGAYMFNLGCFNSRRLFATEKVKRYTGEFKPRHVVVEGDLIIANTDMTQNRDILGRPLLVSDGFEPGFISHHVFKVTTTTKDPSLAIAHRLFMLFALREQSFRERAIGYATGTTVLALPESAVTGCPVCMPPVPLLLSFSEIAKVMLDGIRENEREARLLTDIRDHLLPRLISGKLKISEAEELIEAAFA